MTIELYISKKCEFSVEANLPGHILDKSPLPPIASNNEDNLRPMTALAPKTQLPRIDHPKPPLPLETIPSSSSPIQQEKVLNLDESSASTLLGIVIFRPFFPSRSLRFISCMCNNRYLSLFTIRPFCARWTNSILSSSSIMKNHGNCSMQFASLSN